MPAPAAAPRLLCRSLGKRLPSGDHLLTVLDGVELSVGAGECVAILGPSGSGKSTLLGLLAGLDRPTSGSVVVDGTDLSTLDEDGLALLRRRSIGFVFQSFQLLGNLTARENVLLPLELGGVPGAEARADELLRAVGLGERGHHYPSQLSGGEQQRVAVARAFGPRPPIVLADEPTGNLDGDTGARLLDLIFEQAGSEGTTLVIVTHDSALAARADRAVHMADGRLVDGSPPHVAHTGQPAAARGDAGRGHVAGDIADADAAARQGDAPPAAASTRGADRDP